MRHFLPLAFAAVFVSPLYGAGGDDTRLELADLPAYRAALDEANGTPEPPMHVTFRALWDNPGTYEGKRVAVEGRIIRRFRQAAFGTFPALVEAWVTEPSGDPFCLVYPASNESTLPARATVRFVGTYLKRIRYEGGDVPRLAPLLVGPSGPTSIGRKATSSPPRGAGDARVDWAVGLIVALGAILVIAWQYGKKPATRTGPLDPDPPLAFLPAPEGEHEERFGQ